MKKTIQTLIITVAFCLATVAWVSAQSHDGHDHGSMDHGEDHSGQDMGEGKMDHGAMGHGSMDHGSMGHGDPMGEMIHQSTVDGHEFMYHLIDMREKMKDMPEMKNTHHLMVYVKDPSGNQMAEAKAGYLIENPDGSSQRAMTMPMSGGHGADIALDAPGTYTVKTKVVAGDETLMDSFSYEVK